MFTHHPVLSGLEEDLQLVNAPLALSIPSVTVYVSRLFAVNSNHKPNLKGSYGQEGVLVQKRDINQLRCFLATKCSSVIVRALPRQVLGRRFSELRPNELQKARFHATDAHCASGPNLVPKHKEHIVMLFSARCCFSTSIKLPRSQGPKHVGAHKPPKEKQHIEMKREYSFICRPWSFHCRMLMTIFFFKTILYCGGLNVDFLNGRVLSR